MAASEILLDFLRFLHHFVFETISDWVRLKGILISKIKKIQNPTTTIFIDFYLF
jgi:hypothetical protein